MSEYVHTVGSDEQARIARFLRVFAVGVVLFVLLMITLFITADRWLKLISIESERRFIEPYIDLLVESEWLDADPVLQAYVNDITQEINATLDNSWDDDFELRVYVIESELINAFATLGGYIFVFDGIVDAVDDENSLAMVLGHEVAHVHHRDPLLGTGRGMLIQLAISALSGNGIDPSAANVSSEVILMSYSRDQELAADEVALQLLHERYGHVGGATTLFEIIDDDAESYELEALLSTHPDTNARIERMQELTAEYGWARREPVPYPDAVRSALQD
ncbi:MAG: M48 family metallopeptidase [Woeseiaceae bacterium]